MKAWRSESGYNPISLHAVLQLGHAGEGVEILAIGMLRDQESGASIGPRR